MTHNIYIYIAIMAATSYAIRVLPLTLIRKQIKSKFLRSFLYYVPYVTLAVMTFPAIMDATQSPIAGLAALLVGIVAAWIGAGLFPVSILCCLVVFVLEFFLV
ncbi:MAG: AzlD domain-containing protein [Acetatifactor sp.]|nr:AzlD domain-containing protein [Acetatifactor sp.]